MEQTVSEHPKPLDNCYSMHNQATYCWVVILIINTWLSYVQHLSGKGSNNSDTSNKLPELWLR